ncbi:DUF742 domain-containing protein [Streptacidiphilus anmyonensis]|uniref:DUF742 domain-containing protein n=1 Tax=Streptacidiphilus anmyonensis TaxID=405782 RepID=UPI000A05A338|nr:DUF742 domain-containing protein [Streptacidiphilus anmyonensis]
MTPPEDQNGQYGAAYPGTGHDAFGGPAGGYAPAPGYAGYNQAPSAGQSGYWQDQQPQEWQPQSQPLGRPHTPVEQDQDDEPLIRPYAMTGGRTRPRYQLAIEALVSTTAAPERIGSLLPEHQRICSLCTDIKSVAEISALLSMPLGVARILVADLAESGLVAIHQPAAGGETGGTPDVTLLERVLSGLRKL